jgi:hypothetical protein
LSGDSFGSGKTFAFFQMFGTMPVIKERLNIVVITGARSNEKFFQNQ